MSHREMAPSKQQVHKARQDLLDSRKEKEKREELRKKKVRYS